MAATSGVAAVNIGGSTLHSVLGIQISIEPAASTNQQILAWSEFSVLLIDECGMMSTAMFDLLDTRLRLLKNRPDKAFGGIHLVLIGDLYQLPPIATCIYRPPVNTSHGLRKNNQEKYAVASDRVRLLWKNHWQTSLYKWTTTDSKMP